MPGDLLDVILVVLAAAFAVDGYRQGFVVGALGVIGFLGGAAAGAALSPGVAQALVRSPSQQALVAIVVVFLVALTGQLLASLAGAALRSRLAWRPATVMDAAGGAAVSAMSVLLIAWFIGSAVAAAPYPAVARQVDYSVVLRGVGRLMPGPAHDMFSGFGRMLTRGPSGQVFWELGGEGAWAIRPPAPGVADAPGLARARHSIVMVEGSSATGRAGEGSGFVVAPHQVLTNAHVVAATAGVVVAADGRPARYPARVVYFDPRRDIAVLYVPRLNARPLHLAPGARRGGGAIVAGYPRGRVLTAAAARVGAKVAAASPTIYGGGAVIRHVYPVRADIQPGNSGSPLLAPGGSVYGMVFAATGTGNAGYALAAGEISPAVRAAAGRTAAVSTQPWHCPAL